MKSESMDAQTAQPTILRATSLAGEERDTLLQEQRDLMQANQLAIVELRQTVTITRLLIGKNHILTVQWERSKEKCPSRGASYLRCAIESKGFAREDAMPQGFRIDVVPEE